MRIKIIVLLMLINSAIQAATYYVSNSDGNDSDTGLSELLAWQTLDKVNASSFAAGDSILFKKGDSWIGTLTVPSNGTLVNRIVFSSYGTGDSPIITGFASVSSWTDLGENIWESTNAVSTLSTCNVVSINDTLIPVARYPKVTDVNKGYLTYTASTTTSLTCGDLDDSDWVGAEVVIRTSNFTIDRRIITSHSDSTISWTTATGRTPENGFGFFIQADSETLTQQNDWYFNPSTKKLKIYSTSEPSGVKVSTIEKLVDITKNYITIDGIDLVGANQYGITHNTADTPAKTYITIKNCNISFVGITGVYLRGTYVSYVDNTISNCHGSALLTTSSSGNVTMTGNTVSNIGVNAGQATVFNAIGSGNYTNNVMIQNNSISNVGFNGIAFHGTNITIKNNFIDTYCQTMDDGGGIYTYTGTEAVLDNVLLDGNVIINGVGAPEGTNLSFPAIAAGIYCDNNSENIEIKNNSIYRARKFGLHLNDANKINVHNNTVFDTWETQSGETASQFKLDYPNNLVGNLANIQINNNKFISKSINQRTLDMFSYVDLLIPLFGSADNNIYARPIDDNKTIYADQPSEWSGAKEAKTLAEWQTFSGQDANSTKSLQAIASESDLRFEYNVTASPKPVVLSVPMINMAGSKYPYNIILQPYTSAVLIPDNSPILRPRPIMKNGKWLGTMKW